MSRLRSSEQGVVLVNVLVIVALASAVVVVMLTAQTDAIRRTQQFRDAADAHSVALSGVASAVVALRRDAATGEPIDHAREGWAALAEEDAEIQGGTFSLRIVDAQGRFNVNNLYRGGLAAAQVFRRIGDTLQIPADEAERIVLRVGEGGPVRSLRELRAAGIGPETIERLSIMVTALPGNTDININAAEEVLIAIMLGNPVAANTLVRQRSRAGFLTPQDLQRTRVLMPGGIGFASDHFTVDVAVRMGDAAQRLEALIGRARTRSGPTATVLTLKRKAAAP